MSDAIRACGSRNAIHHPRATRGAAARGFLVVMAMAILSSGCSARFEASIDRGGGALISAKVSVSPSVAAKLRALAGAPETAPLFDPAAVKAGLSARKGVTSVSASRPDPDSLLVKVAVSDLSLLASAPDVSGIIGFDSEGGVRKLTISLSRDHGAELPGLFPGLDRDLVEALSPPALSGDDYSPAEYRDALATILGTKTLPALDAASIDIALHVPGEITAFKGGRVEGSTWRASIPLLDLLVLEKPIELSISWR